MKFSPSVIICAEIDRLRRAAADHSEMRGWLTEGERALLALADLVDRATSALDGEAKRGMTARQLSLLEDLRAAVPRRREAVP